MSDPTQEEAYAYYARKAAQRGIPDYMIPGLQRWIVNRVTPGSFLLAVLENDLRGACELADENNRELLFNYVSFLYNDAPSPCWGSVTKVMDWAQGKV